MGILEVGESCADVCTSILMDPWENYFDLVAEGGVSILKGMGMLRFDPRYYSKELGSTLLVKHIPPRRRTLHAVQGYVGAALGKRENKELR